MANFKYCGYTKAELNKEVKDKKLSECEKEFLNMTDEEMKELIKTMEGE